MPSTYDPLLRLELQATGENATTWGIKTNTNLDLLAESIAGAVTLNVAGSGDFTLSTASGAEDEARYAILVLTGTLTGDRNIIVPSSPKNYTVINNTSGAFTVTLKQSAGTGLLIPRDGPTITVCTSTTCVDSIGATPYTKTLLAATSVQAAVSALGLANTATIVATSIGSALITAADTSAGRAAIEAAKSGVVTGSGLTMTTSRLLGRTTAATGAVEEITVGTGLSLTDGSLTAVPTALQLREQLFTTGGTWTGPAGVTQARVIVIGAGGGGGGGVGGCCGADGRPGGSGGISVGVVSVTPSTSYTITIGTGGTGGASAGFNGTSGGTSSFSSLMSATGGTGGGGGGGSSGASGSGSGGTLRNGGTPAVVASPFTGTTRVGGSGTAAIAWSASAASAAGNGGGGGIGSQAGAGGTNGIVYVEWVGI
jgi:hypothetical protein